jgi:hypothetical protein
MIADGWEVFEVEGPVYGDDGRVLTQTARVRGIRKTFRLPAPTNNVESSPEMTLVYECSSCKASGVKLWRQYQTFLDHIELLCCDCGAKDQGKELVDLQPDGSWGEMKSDQIGWLVPAVPTDHGTFWGYSSVPDEGVRWWRALPNRRA